MSRENEFMGFIGDMADMLGLDIANAVIISPEGEPIDMKEMAKRFGEEACHAANNVKAGAEKCYHSVKNMATEAKYAELKKNLVMSGMTEEEAEAAIAPYRARIDREKAEAKAKAERAAKAKNDIVEQTLKSIASVYGYRVENAVRVNGVPQVDAVTRIAGKMSGTPMYCEVLFDVHKGFYVVPTNNMAEITEINSDNVMFELSNAVALCSALNNISPSTWPEV